MCEPKFKCGLGFKYLRTFNLAFLAKQGWRILLKENTMLHRLYKARYFTKGQFLDAGLGHNPSYTWRGLWEAKKWLIQESKWRIGDGKRAKIWRDSCISGHQTLDLEDIIIRKSKGMVVLIVSLNENT